MASIADIRLKLLNAYEIITDPKRRRRYDRVWPSIRDRLRSQEDREEEQSAKQGKATEERAAKSVIEAEKSTKRKRRAEEEADKGREERGRWQSEERKRKGKEIEDQPEMSERFKNLEEIASKIRGRNQIQDQKTEETQRRQMLLHDLSITRASCERKIAKVKPLVTSAEAEVKRLEHDINRKGQHKMWKSRKKAFPQQFANLKAERDKLQLHEATLSAWQSDVDDLRALEKQALESNEGYLKGNLIQMQQYDRKARRLRVRQIHERFAKAAKERAGQGSAVEREADEPAMNEQTTDDDNASTEEEGKEPREQTSQEERTRNGEQGKKRKAADQIEEAVQGAHKRQETCSHIDDRTETAEFWYCKVCDEAMRYNGVEHYLCSYRCRNCERIFCAGCRRNPRSHGGL